MTLTVEFCGEASELRAGETFTIGREADLAIDDNQFLHRRFLHIEQQNGLWLLTNVGSQLTATVADPTGHMEAYVAPGASLPLVFAHVNVSFTAGPTTYLVGITNSEPAFSTTPVQTDVSGETTIGAMQLTPDQRRLVVALAEPRLRLEGHASVTLPSSAEAARRLGWTITKFNRKLDHLCQKLQRIGVRGLHGGPDRLASNRRVRLVEYAVATRLVTRDHLALLDHDKLLDHDALLDHDEDGAEPNVPAELRH